MLENVCINIQQQTADEIDLNWPGKRPPASNDGCYVPPKKPNNFLISSICQQEGVVIKTLSQI